MAVSLAKTYNLERYEYKYLVPADFVATLRERILPYIEYDIYSQKRNDKTYIVRSIYFDSPDLDFYYEKLDGKKIRRKLRLRTYNEVAENAPFFLEIKRKFSERIVKERAILPRDYLLSVCYGRINPNGHLKNSFLEKKTIEKFICNLEHKDLTPVILVTYDREAFASLGENNLRITFDQNIRSLTYPKIEDIFDEDNLIPVFDNNIILEVKFNWYMPAWLRKIMMTLPVYKHSFSKYCLGIDRTGINVPLYFRAFWENSQCRSLCACKEKVNEKDLVHV